MANLIKFKGPAPELIKIALATGTEATFFGSAPTYTPIYFDSELLEATYGNQVFLDVDLQKNFVWLSEAVSGECLNKMNDFVNNTAVLIWEDYFEYPDGSFPIGGWILLGSPTTAEISSNRAWLVGAAGTGIRRVFTNESAVRFKFTVIVDSSLSGSYNLNSFGLTFEDTGTRESLNFTEDSVFYASGNRDNASEYLAIESSSLGSEIYIDYIKIEKIL